MTEELFKRAAAAVRNCPDHGQLEGDAFAREVRTVVKAANIKQASPVRLLPSAIAKDIR